jgi:2-phosphosulfolactate phosphatase
MSQEPDQRQFAVRMEWGLRGAEAISMGADHAVIVDVLSFTTAVSVALDQRTEVFPYPWRDESAMAFARQHRATLAVNRREATSSGTPAAQAIAAQAIAAQASAAQASAAQADPTVGAPSPPLVSLSPASIRAAPGLDRIVLPSPNGSALATALAPSGRRILAGCLRNRAAVATWLASQPGSSGRPAVIAVIAAGERWPDDTLRPAAEDLWGAGGIIAALENLGVTGLSPEARSAAAAWRAIEPRLGPALASCGSGAELASAGFADDVAIAAELDASSCVPVLSGGRFTDASRRS